MITRPTGHKRYDPLTGKNEYAVVAIRPSWGLLSLLVFLYSLPIRFWLRFLPWHPFQYMSQPSNLVLSTLSLSAFGMILGWVGMKSANHQGSKSSLSKVAFFLNGAVAAILTSSVVLLIVYWRFFR